MTTFTTQYLHNNDPTRNCRTLMYICTSVQSRMFSRMLSWRLMVSAPV